MRKVIYVLVVLLLLASLALSCKPAPTEVIEVNCVSFLPVNHKLGIFIPTIIDRLNQECEGEVVWKLIGGPEVMSGLDQFAGASSGAIDVSFNVSALYTSDVPGALSAVLSKLTPWEERESGFYDLLNELHQEKNTYYLGRWMTGGLYIWTIDPVENLTDLAGRKIRGSGMTWGPWFKALGIAQVSIPAPDTYTALERGVVDGAGWPVIGICDMGWCEVLNYCLDHGGFSASNGMTVMNLDKWNTIPDKLQDKVIKAFGELEHDMVAHFDNLATEEKQIARDYGITFIKLSPAEGKKVTDSGYEAVWETMKELTPELYDELRRLSGN